MLGHEHHKAPTRRHELDPTDQKPTVPLKYRYIGLGIASFFDVCSVVRLALGWAVEFPFTTFTVGVVQHVVESRCTPFILQ